MLILLQLSASNYLIKYPVSYKWKLANIDHQFSKKRYSFWVHNIIVGIDKAEKSQRREIVEWISIIDKTPESIVHFITLSYVEDDSGVFEKLFW